MTSHREKKRTVQAGVRRMLNRPGWDPREFASGNTGIDRTSRAADEIRRQQADGTYESTTDCPECARARQQSGDETALCEKHMRQAMGIE